MTAFFSDRSVRCLIQHSTQVFIAFGGATAMVLLGGFVLADGSRRMIGETQAYCLSPRT
jgi:hypothetical protein